MKKAEIPFLSKKNFTAISCEQIETINLRRIVVTCISALIFELINLLNPMFWKQPILWGGSIYLVLISLGFLFVILVIQKKYPLKNPELFHLLFWIAFPVGVFPFLIRDAAEYQTPMNCILLASVLICAPILKTKDLKIIFSVSAIVNLTAAFFAGNTLPYYYLQLIAVNIAAFFLARNLHGRYFGLLNEQRRNYETYLQSQLEQQALEVSLKQEKLANEAKSDFLSRMSHDLRTPLNGIIGISNLAMNENLSREQTTKYLHEINHSSQYLLSLINDVLDMSKIENHKMELHYAPYNIYEFTDVINSVIKEQCEAKNIDFQIIIHDISVQWIMLDKLRFNQVFLNLLSNSIKFTPKGGTIELIIETLSQTESAIKKRFTVKDSGIGMSPDFIQKAFDPFSQEETESHSDGTGLGLSIVKNIVELMGGSVQIKSAVGSGTSVFVELEVKKAPPPKTAGHSEKHSFNLRGKRILLCEDHPLNTEIAVVLLKNKGIIVDTADNGKKGVELFKNAPPEYYQAILMDIQMPVMDGLEAAKKIRTLPRADAASIPIIAMTANTFEEDKQASFRAGMNAHLAKPINPQQLYRTIEQEIANHK